MGQLSPGSFGVRSLRCTWEPVIASWGVGGLGFWAGGPGTNQRVIFHAIWADKIFVFATRPLMMATMVWELALAMQGQFAVEAFSSIWSSHAAPDLRHTEIPARLGT